MLQFDIRVTVHELIGTKEERDFDSDEDLDLQILNEILYTLEEFHYDRYRKMENPQDRIFRVTISKAEKVR